MKTQNQIKRTLSEETGLLYLKDLLDSKTFSNRAEVIKEVCKEFNFYDTKGQVPLMSAYLSAIKFNFRRQKWQDIARNLKYNL